MDGTFCILHMLVVTVKYASNATTRRNTYAMAQKSLQKKIQSKREAEYVLKNIQQRRIRSSLK